MLKLILFLLRVMRSRSQHKQQKITSVVIIVINSPK